jgi:hypothetical protein
LNEQVSPLSTFKLFFVQREGKSERVLHQETIGQGSWCHVLFYDVGATGTAPAVEGTSNTDSIVFVWVDGQRTCAYVFRIHQSSIKKVFEEAQGRSWYSFQDIDCDGSFEVIKHDSSWHLEDGYPVKLAAKLKGHQFGKATYKFDGQAYKLIDIQPEDQTRAK